MGAASDDLDKKKQDEYKKGWTYLPNGEPSGGPQFEKAMSEVARQKAADEEYDKAGQAAKDLKTKRASEGKIRY